MRIRPARASDAGALSELLIAAGVEGWGAFLGREQIQAAATARVQPADLVAEDDDGIAGFVEPRYVKDLLSN